jgi:outer membrane receptor protein involved in Fe transport
LNADAPLQNLSRHSGNLIGLYEYGKVSARLAYNWRSKFLSGVANFAGIGPLPAYTRGYGWLDASIALRIDPNLTLSIEGGNLTGTLRRSYYGVETRPQDAFVNDRQIAVRVSARF